MPRPTEEELVKIRELYQERERANRELDRILSKLSALLLAQPSYQKWFDGDGRIESLPEWIHQVTGGRPLYHSQRAVVQRKPSKPKEKTYAVSEEHQDAITDKLFKLMDKGENA